MAQHLRETEREKAEKIKRELESFRLHLARTLPVEKAASSESHSAEAVAAEPKPVPLITSKLTSSGSQSVEATGQHSIGELFKWKGKTYREGRKGTGVCTSHSLDDIQEYMSECPLNTLNAKFADEVPFESVEDWVTTIRQACTAPGAAFFWPSEKLSFQRALAVALAHLPPGCFITIRSAKPLPQRLKCTTSPSGLAYYVQELYHGTSVHNVIGIAEGGFKAGLGAGCDALQEHFGIPVAGTYVAKTWTVASYYPMETSSKPHPANKNGVPGGSLMAQDNSFPMRAVIRCLANTTDQLWHKGSNQS